MSLIQNLVPLVRPYYQSPDPAHDWAHVGRVADSAAKIAVNENIDPLCVLAAVYCHDLINLPKNHPDRKNASTLAAQEAVPLLKKAGFDSSQIELIFSAITEHSFSAGLKPSSPIGAIVQDADRLDALGAIGILRCASVSTQVQSSFYDSYDPFAQSRELNDKKFMIDHYFTKLFKLPQLMNTALGKELANQRVRYMREFLNHLEKEIKNSCG